MYVHQTRRNVNSEIVESGLCLNSNDTQYTNKVYNFQILNICR